jgi:hypothetical protein
MKRREEGGKNLSVLVILARITIDFIKPWGQGEGVCRIGSGHVIVGWRP